MYVKGLSTFLYAGALVAFAPILALADDAKKTETIPAPGPAVGGACPPANCAPTTCKVRVCEWVDEPCEYTRTTYKHENRQETYTAYRCETVNECKTKQVTCYKQVCETVMENRCVTKKIPCWEERTEMVTKLRCVQVTEMVSRPKISSHWECVQVPSFFNKCCDPCNPCANSCRTVKKLVVDCCTECVPVCRTKIVKECVPVCKKVCTYKCVTENVCVPVTRTRCVPECKTVTYNECRKVMVPYQATRCVSVCVPCTEVVKGTKKVAHWVEKDVPVCNDCCDTGCGHGGLFSGLKGKFAGFGKSCCSAPACGVAASCNSCGK